MDAKQAADAAGKHGRRRVANGDSDRHLETDSENKSEIGSVTARKSARRDAHSLKYAVPTMRSTWPSSLRPTVCVRSESSSSPGMRVVPSTWTAAAALTRRQTGERVGGEGRGRRREEEKEKEKEKGRRKEVRRKGEESDLFEAVHADGHRAADAEALERPVVDAKLEVDGRRDKLCQAPAGIRLERRLEHIVGGVGAEVVHIGYQRIAAP